MGYATVAYQWHDPCLTVGMTTASKISDRIVDAILAKKLAPGCRLGEQDLAQLFDCSRTIVREALTRLAARGVVTVKARRGWFLVEPAWDEAREVFEARLIIETGLLRNAGPPGAEALTRLRHHIAQQTAALTSGDVGLRSLLLGDFHVCLAECLGNKLLAETLRDLTVRTTLLAVRHQSQDDAARSCEEHKQIVAALACDDTAGAERLMAVHLGTWSSKLRVPGSDSGLAHLRRALEPVRPAAWPLHSSLASNHGGRSPSFT
jgi:DNA-binding GntR family transcriptional regulator